MLGNHRVTICDPRVISRTLRVTLRKYHAEIGNRRVAVGNHRITPVSIVLQNVPTLFR